MPPRRPAAAASGARAPTPAAPDAPAADRAGEDAGAVTGDAADPPAGGAVDGEAALTVAAVARRLGVAPATLRTWDRRYGLGPAAHRTGAHRRYSEADVRRLAAVRRQVVAGVPVAEAALRTGAGTEVGPSAVRSQDEDQATGGAGTTWALPTASPAPYAGSARVEQDPAALVRRLVLAAHALDQEVLVEELSTAAAADGVVRTWDELAVPVLVELGRFWAETGSGIEVEHLASDAVAAVLRGHAAVQRPARRAGAALPQPPVLLACASGERHSLPLVAVSAGLAERGVVARVLGSDLPGRSLSQAVRRTRPTAVFLWSSRRRPTDDHAVQALPVTRPGPSVVLGGPGWGERPPPRGRVVTSLQAAVEALCAPV